MRQAPILPGQILEDKVSPGGFFYWTLAVCAHVIGIGGIGIGHLGHCLFELSSQSQTHKSSQVPRTTPPVMLFVIKKVSCPFV